MTRVFRVVLWGMAAAGLALLSASLAGAMIAPGDSLAVVRWQIAAGVAILALALSVCGARRGLWLLVPAGLALAQAGWAWFQPQSGAGAGWTVYQKNLSFRLRDPAPVIADIRAAAPDLLTLQEVTPANTRVLAAVSDLLPGQVVCPGRRVGGPALATRWPVVPGTETCLFEAGIAAVKVTTPEGPRWLVSVHLHWPWPYMPPGYVDRVVRDLTGFDAPVLIGGDFNMVPWAARNRRIAEVTGTDRIGRALNTFPRFGPLFPLPIDHVYAPDGASGHAELRPLLGSDHRGILVRIDPD